MAGPRQPASAPVKLLVTNIQPLLNLRSVACCLVLDNRRHLPSLLKPSLGPLGPLMSLAPPPGIALRPEPQQPYTHPSIPHLQNAMARMT
ncbi:hypothetical protein MUK42_23985 [Musa troglodytarum]|uniref:Uncharacterized protein n=1 Tax=Musa troglodytarum TaxID=320322 RepID=A0A9E7EXJ7_9LILI|nr:hypothetical protein MUK42_23985 [Musa troglodytarum]